MMTSSTPGGITRPKLAIGGTVSLTCWCRIAIAAPRNGDLPANIRYTMMASE